jgi:hypothetical protein
MYRLCQTIIFIHSDYCCEREPHDVGDEQRPKSVSGFGGSERREHEREMAYGVGSMGTKEWLGH